MVQHKERLTFDRQILCKYCGANDTVKVGTKSGNQQYRCKVCKRKFSDNGSLIGMRTNSDAIAAAISMFFDGIATNALDEQLKSQYYLDVSSSTVWRWIMKYAKLASIYTSQYPIELGPVWMVDETQMKIGGKVYWFWDVIDTKTRFLVGSHLSRTRKQSDAIQLLKLCKARALHPPKYILTDRLLIYERAVWKAFYTLKKETRATHIESEGMRSPTNINILERFHGSIKQRTKVMRGLKSPTSAKIILQGSVVHYNFFRPHGYLEGDTPSIAANHPLQFSNWSELLVAMDGERQASRLWKNPISKEVIEYYV